MDIQCRGAFLGHFWSFIRGSQIPPKNRRSKASQISSKWSSFERFQASAGHWPTNGYFRPWGARMDIQCRGAPVNIDKSGDNIDKSRQNGRKLQKLSIISINIDKMLFNFPICRPIPFNNHRKHIQSTTLNWEMVRKLFWIGLGNLFILKTSRLVHL